MHDVGMAIASSSPAPISLGSACSGDGSLGHVATVQANASHRPRMRTKGDPSEAQSKRTRVLRVGCGRGRHSRLMCFIHMLC